MNKNVCRTRASVFDELQDNTVIAEQIYDTIPTIYCDEFTRLILIVFILRTIVFRKKRKLINIYHITHTISVLPIAIFHRRTALALSSRSQRAVLTPSYSVYEYGTKILFFIVYYRFIRVQYKKTKTAYRNRTNDFNAL